MQFRRQTVVGMMGIAVLMPFTGLLLANFAHAGLILTNGSFENGTDTGVDVGSVNEYTMPGWGTKETADTDGTNNNLNTVLDGTLETMSATDGTRWVRLATTSSVYGAIYQDLGQFDNVGDEVSITADALFHNTSYSSDEMQMELRRSAWDTGTLLTSFDALEGTHSQLSIDYTSQAADLGEDIYLVIHANDAITSRAGTDNVQLTFTPIPEPGTSVLLLLGLAAVLGRGRAARRRI